MARTVDGDKEALGCLFRRYARLVRAAQIRFASELPTCSMSSDFVTRAFLDKFLFADHSRTGFIGGHYGYPLPI
jgi:hypothetical protein